VFPRLERCGENSSVRNELIELGDRVAVDDSVDPHLGAGGCNELHEETLGKRRIVHPFGNNLTPLIAVEFNSSEHAYDDWAFGKCEA
jgi:hypothetical protein